jgi:ECF transporter S component (folate family)
MIFTGEQDFMIKRILDVLGISEMAANFKNVRTIALTAVLIALTVVGNGMTKIPIAMGLEIRFGFIFLATIAYLFGPVVTFAAGFITSTLAFLLFPPGLGYNVLFDLNAGLSGFIYAVFLYRRNYKSEYFIVWIVAAKVAVNFICNIIINTALLKVYIGSFADLVSITRVFKNVALLPGEIVLMLIVVKYVAESAKRYKFVKYVGNDKKREKEAAT